MADDITNEITRNCLLTRTRRISRVITGIYDEEYRPFGINRAAGLLACDDIQAGVSEPRRDRAAKPSRSINPDAKSSAHDVEWMDRRSSA